MVIDTLRNDDTFLHIAYFPTAHQIMELQDVGLDVTM